MKRIIILSDAVEPRYDLVSHLQKLFPECEIQIISCGSENIEERMVSETTFSKKTKLGETVT